MSSAANSSRKRGTASRNHPFVNCLVQWRFLLTLGLGRGVESITRPHPPSAVPPRRATPRRRAYCKVQEHVLDRLPSCRLATPRPATLAAAGGLWEVIVVSISPSAARGRLDWEGGGGGGGWPEICLRFRALPHAFHSLSHLPRLSPARERGRERARDRGER